MTLVGADSQAGDRKGLKREEEPEEYVVLLLMKDRLVSSAIDAELYNF